MAPRAQNGSPSSSASLAPKHSPYAPVDHVRWNGPQAIKQVDSNSLCDRDDGDDDDDDSSCGGMTKGTIGQVVSPPISAPLAPSTSISTTSSTYPTTTSTTGNEQTTTDTVQMTTLTITKTRATTVTVAKATASITCSYEASSTGASPLSSTYQKSCATATSSSAGIEALSSDSITPGALAGISAGAVALFLLLVAALCLYLLPHRFLTCINRCRDRDSYTRSHSSAISPSCSCRHGMPFGMATTPLSGGMGLDSPASTRNPYQPQRQYPYSPYHINTNMTTVTAAANNNNMMSDSRRGSRTENLISPLQQHPVTPSSSQSQRFPWRASETFALSSLLPQVQTPPLTLLPASNNTNNNNIVNKTPATINYSHIPIPAEPLTPVHLSGYPGNPQRLSAASYGDETNSMYTSVAASSQYNSNGAQYATKLAPAPAPRRWLSINTQSSAPVVAPQEITLPTVDQTAAPPQQQQQTWFDSNSSNSLTHSSGTRSTSHYSAASLTNTDSRLSEMQPGYGNTPRNLTSSPTKSQMVVPQREHEQQQYTIPGMVGLDEAIDEVPPLRTFRTTVQREASYQPQHQQPPPSVRPYSSSSGSRGSQNLYQYTWEQQQHENNGEDGVPGDIMRYSDPRGPYERSNFL